MKKIFFLLAVLFSATVANLQAANVYFKTTAATSWWANDGAKIGAYFQIGEDPIDGGAYAQFFTLVPGTTDTYVGTVPEGEDPFVAVQFLRYNSAATNPDDMNYWNATGIETWDGTNDMFTATGSGDTWDSTTGTWSKYNSTTITSWTIVGDEIMMGSKWDPADTNNDMILIAGAYMLEKQAYLTEGSYDYKAVANHAFGIKELPASGNQTLEIDADGDYTITFSMDAMGNTLGAFAELDTAIENINDDGDNTRAEKFIEDGRLFIRVNGVLYNAIGVPVQ